MWITTSDGVRLYYEQNGSGHDLVFLHGYTCTLNDWRSIAEPLSESYQVLLTDFRCHGQSDKPVRSLSIGGYSDDVHFICAQLGVSKPTILGHSMGGMVALDYALRYSDEVRALVLAEGHSHIETTARLTGSGVSDERTDPQIAWAIAEQMNEGARYIDTSLWQSLMDFDVRPLLHHLTIPILFLWGDRYGDVTEERFASLLEAFGYSGMDNVEARLIRNSHHFLMLEQPEQVLTAITQFLRKVYG